MTTTRILCLCLASLFLVACDDDGGSNTVSDTTMCMGTYAAVNRGQLESAVTSTTGACTSEADLDAVCTQDLRSISGACALLTCVGSISNPSEFAPCMNECIKAGTSRDPSDGCISCYTATVSCTAANCLAPCSANSSSPECQMCQLTNGCTPAFFQCSGLPLPTAFADSGM